MLELEAWRVAQNIPELSFLLELISWLVVWEEEACEVCCNKERRALCCSGVKAVDEGSATTSFCPRDCKSSSISWSSKEYWLIVLPLYKWGGNHVSCNRCLPYGLFCYSKNKSWILFLDLFHLMNGLHDLGLCHKKHGWYPFGLCHKDHDWYPLEQKLENHQTKQAASLVEWE